MVALTISYLDGSVNKRTARLYSSDGPAPRGHQLIESGVHLAGSRRAGAEAAARFASVMLVAWFASIALPPVDSTAKFHPCVVEVHAAVLAGLERFEHEVGAAIHFSNESRKPSQTIVDLYQVAT